MTDIKTFIGNNVWIIPLAIVLAFGMGLWMGSGRQSDDQSDPAKGEAEATIWTCSMHPQIRQPKPGKCPICAMDLIPLKRGASSTGPRELEMSETAMKLAEIQTVRAERKFVVNPVRMVGKVAYDETRVKTISAWVGGRLDRLFVDYKGVPVKQNDHMVSMYSPEILVAQKELLQAMEAFQSAQGDSKPSAQAILDAGREKLRLWGLTEEQIATIESRGTATNNITINAPVSGIVIDKVALEGSYVNTGQPIYKIADLSHLWVMLDAYESDLPWLRYGQEVTFETRAVPGTKFRGRISFISPILNPQTRTVRVRVNVPNPDYKLKPEMFVRATVESRLAATGKVIDPNLAGKWISPMHPEIVKDEPGNCDICGMPLVRAETLGFIEPKDEQAPLVVPASAVLPTGVRAVVYIRVPDREKPTFAGREVQLGPRAGQYYVINDGLKEGEEVVVNGNFKIDSALQIQAKPSMMSMPSGHEFHTQPGQHTSAEPITALPDEFRSAWNTFVGAYLELQVALAKDDATASSKAFHALAVAFEGIKHAGLSDQAHQAWMQDAKSFAKINEQSKGAKSLKSMREAFSLLSEQVLASIQRYGHQHKTPLVQAHCPMAFDDRGADWLQAGETINNPYFGDEMLRCGEVKETFKPKTSIKATMPPAHEGSHGH